MSLHTLGWNEYYQNIFTQQAGSEKLPARVTAEYRGQYLVHTGTEELSAEISGALRFRCAKESEFPKVGDWVAVTRYDLDKALIHDVLPRSNSLSRKKAGTGSDEQVLACNVTVLAVVMGLDGDFNLSRLERYVALAKTQGCRSLVILNKADLVAEDDEQIVRVKQRTSPDQLLIVSALNAADIENIRRAFLPGDTVVLLGSSGAGKSTIVNGLLGEQRQKTSAVREADSRGRHTTTTRELFMVRGEICIIDSPGIRELQLWDGTEDALAETFDDIAALAAACRFTDCKHDREPGCAVTAAIADGTLDARRLANYQKLLRETEYRSLNSRQIEEKKIENMFGGKAEYKRKMTEFKRKKG